MMFNKWEKYNRTPKGIYNHLKKSAGKRHIVFELPQSAFIDWYNDIEKICVYCGITVEEIKDRNPFPSWKHNIRLSIDRIDGAKGYSTDNIHLTCWACNKVKSDLFSHQEMMVIGSVVGNIWNARYKKRVRGK